MKQYPIISSRAPAWRRGVALALLLSWPAEGGVALAQQQDPAQRRPATQQAPAQRRPAQQRPGQPRPGAPRDTVPRDTARRDSARRPEPPADTLFDRLLALPGYTPVEYRGDSAEFRNRERTLRLRGNPEVKRGQETLTSRDSLIYRERSEFIEAYGEPRATGAEGQDIVGDVMFYDLRLRRASVLGARTKITQSATWFVEGDVTEERGERVYASNSTFTSDDREDPAYHFRAGKIMVVRDRVLVGRPAYLYFKNVPVFVLPFIVQDLEKGRRSGFLIPDFEINDILRTNTGRGLRGTGREIGNIGYYWAINQYMGLQLSGRWRSGTYTGVRGAYQFNWRRRFLSGSVDLEQFWEEAGSTQQTLQAAASWKPSERTDLTLSANYASSSRFERDRSTNPFRQTEDLNSSLSVSRRMDWGQFTAGAERRQSLGTGDVNFTPRFTLSPNPITLFPAASAEGAAWYNDITLTWGLNGSRTTFYPGDPLATRRPGTDVIQLSSSPGINIGGLSINTGVSYDRRVAEPLSAADSLTAPDATPLQRQALAGTTTETASTSASVSYQINLIGQTRLSPGLSLQQSFVRRATTEAVPDSLVDSYGTFVGGSPRLAFNAELATELFGFFPGFGNYSAIRHNLRPGLGYSYSPRVEQNDVQRQVFGVQGGRELNQLTIRLDQTFEAKVRDPDPVEGPPAAVAGDTAGTDSAGVANRNRGNQAQPPESRKITLLALNTTGLLYEFVPNQAGVRGFTTPDITNTIRTDLFGGFNVTVSHDLFEDDILPEPVPPPGTNAGVVTTRRGRFNPFLTSVNTSFSLNQNSAFFRWLGFARATENERATERGDTPADAGRQPAVPPGGMNATNNNQDFGGGPWNMQLTYSLQRRRPAVGGREPVFFDRGNQEVSGILSFQPSRNWAVSWQTGYSITDGEFHTHVLNFKRDLYRWQANFDFTRGPNGNTSFGFSVHLTDLPDLKADYRESNLGTERPEETRRR